MATVTSAMITTTSPLRSTWVARRGFCQRVDPCDSRLMDRFRNTVRGSHSGFHAERQVVRVDPGEVNPTARLDDFRPKFGEFSGSVRSRETTHGPGIVSPVHRQRLL